MSVINKVLEVYRENAKTDLGNKLTTMWLAGRGIRESQIDKFQLGLHTEKILDTVLDPEIKKQAQTLSKTLFFDFFERKDGTLFEDRAPRIIYPLFKNEFGTYKLVGFHSRAITPTGLTHRHLTGFHYNIFNEKQLSECDQEIVITEGQNDCIIMCQEGFKSIGLLGVRKFNKENADTLLFHNIKKVHIIFDNDSNGSGFKGAVRTASIITENDIEVNICEIPQIIKKHELHTKTDINDLYLHDPSNFKKIINKTIRSSIKFKRTKKREIKKRSTIRFNTNVLITDLYYFDNLNRNIVSCKCMLPAHEDSKGSFRLYTRTNTFYCFGCGRGGGVVDFFAVMNGFTKSEAIRYLNERKK